MTSSFARSLGFLVLVIGLSATVGCGKEVLTDGDPGRLGSVSGQDAAGEPNKRDEAPMTKNPAEGEQPNGSGTPATLPSPSSNGGAATDAAKSGEPVGDPATPSKPAPKPLKGFFEYEIYGADCTTGRKTFKEKASYCKALLDELFNCECAPEKRKARHKLDCDV